MKMLKNLKHETVAILSVNICLSRHENKYVFNIISSSINNRGSGALLLWTQRMANIYGSGALLLWTQRMANVCGSGALFMGPSPPPRRPLQPTCNKTL